MSKYEDFQASRSSIGHVDESLERKFRYNLDMKMAKVTHHVTEG